jgi:flagellar FliL protein
MKATENQRGVEMAEETQDPVVESPPPAEPTGRRRGLFRVVKAAAFVTLVVVVELVAAAMLAPTAQETERLAHEYVAAAEGRAAETAAGADSSGPAQDVREVELGIYNITRYNPTTNTTMAIDFELYGTVLAGDESRFQEVFATNQARLREQVIMSLHTASSSDLTDAGLGLIKRRILEKTNRALGQPLVREVLFSKFNFVER